MRRFIKKRFLSGISVRCMWVDERVAHAIPFFCEPTSFPLSVYGLPYMYISLFMANCRS